MIYLYLRKFNPLLPGGGGFDQTFTKHYLEHLLIQNIAKFIIVDTLQEMLNSWILNKNS